MNAVLAALSPSQRAHGAQRMIAATVLVVQALVTFFAVLVAHQLDADQRTLNWTWGGLVTAVALVLCSGLLRRGAWPYLLGLVLQIPVILLGLSVPAMFVVGGCIPGAVRLRRPQGTSAGRREGRDRPSGARRGGQGRTGVSPSWDRAGASVPERRSGSEPRGGVPSMAELSVQ